MAGYFVCPGVHNALLGRLRTLLNNFWLVARDGVDFPLRFINDFLILTLTAR